MALLLSSPEILPFSKHPFIATTALDHLQDTISSNIGERKIEFAPSNIQSESFLTRLQLPASEMLGVQFGPRTHIISNKLSSHHILIPITGQMTIKSIGSDVEITPGKAALHLANEPLYVDWRPHSKAIVIIITQSGLQQLDEASRLFDPKYLTAASNRRVIDLKQGPGMSLLNVVNMICTEAETNGRLLTKGSCLHLFEKLLFEAVLGTRQTVKNQHAVGIPSCSPAQVKHALNYINNHLRYDISIEALTEAAGCSSRTLQNLFSAQFGLGPMTYIKNLKLKMVRKDLLAASPEETKIGDIAAYWGFYHASNFTANYCRLFGEKPSQTLKTIAP